MKTRAIPVVVSLFPPGQRAAAERQGGGTGAHPTMKTKPLAPGLLRKIHAYWRAANYLSVGQIYLYDNPLLQKPLTLAHVKPRLLGHWGTTPGLNFIYVHLNRVIKEHDLNELDALFRGYGYTPYFVEGDDPGKMHQLMAATLDVVTAEIRRIQSEARTKGFKTRPRWPMIILRSPRRSHQVPMGDMSHPGHIKVLESWLKSYRPQELFDPAGKLRAEIAELAPTGARRMSANLHANGGLLLNDLRLPDFRDYAVKVAKPGAAFGEATHVQGEFIRDVINLTKDKPVIFAHHGYPMLIHRLTYRRTNHRNIHVRGFKEEGTTSTPFDMVVMNDLDRFHLVADVIDRVPSLGPRAAYAKQAIRDKLIEHKHCIAKHGEDMPEIRNWKWSRGKAPAKLARPSTTTPA